MLLFFLLLLLLFLLFIRFGPLLLFSLFLRCLLALGGVGLFLRLLGVISRVVGLPIGVAAWVFRLAQRLASQFLKKRAQGGRRYV